MATPVATPDDLRKTRWETVETAIAEAIADWTRPGTELTEDDPRFERLMYDLDDDGLFEDWADREYARTVIRMYLNWKK